jgi:2-polyprenyl-3-methyl-5-hydroxy-6-metoxy-1,4-benzoquinol methylase
MNYLEINKKAWDEKTEIHINSEFYDLQAFLKGKNSLKKPELDVLGDIRGKKILHLQCHFGQDSLSLARMGAIVTGLDFSNVAIDYARKINDELGLNAQFVCSNVYSLPEELINQFDIVFTSYGTIGWLPELQSWANTIKKALVPGGKFIMVDFHPFIWTFDNDLQNIEYDYFNSVPIIEEIDGTYADRNAPIKTRTISWNHGIGEILNTLIRSGITIQEFSELDYSPFNCFANMNKIAVDKFVFAHIPKSIPILYRITGDFH